MRRKRKQQTKSRKKSRAKFCKKRYMKNME
jgi:hypothetical protein